jgi:ribosomal protein L13E
VEQKSLGQAGRLAEEKRSLMVQVRAKVLKRGRKQRPGRGFSREETKKAGSSPAEALRLGVPVDFKRRTAHEENVEALKTFLKGKKVAARPRRKTKS